MGDLGQVTDAVWESFVKMNGLKRLISKTFSDAVSKVLSHDVAVKVKSIVTFSH